MQEEATLVNSGIARLRYIGIPSLLAPCMRRRVTLVSLWNACLALKDQTGCNQSLTAGREYPCLPSRNSGQSEGEPRRVSSRVLSGGEGAVRSRASRRGNARSSRMPGIPSVHSAERSEARLQVCERLTWCMSEPGNCGPRVHAGTGSAWVRAGCRLEELLPDQWKAARDGTIKAAQGISP
jgi:hypothetical protein